MNISQKFSRFGLDADPKGKFIPKRRLRKLSENKRGKIGETEVETYIPSKINNPLSWSNKEQKLKFSQIKNKILKTQSSKTRETNFQRSSTNVDKFKIETGNDTKKEPIDSLRNISLEKKLIGHNVFKEKKKLVNFERHKIKDQVNVTVNQIEQIKRNYSSKNSFSYLNKYSQNSDKLSTTGGFNQSMKQKLNLKKFWEEAKRRNFLRKDFRIVISGPVQKEIDRRLKHKKKLEEAIDLFNQKPKKGYLELLNVNPIYHAKREIAMKNLTRFLFSSNKISKKKYGIFFN